MGSAQILDYLSIAITCGCAGWVRYDAKRIGVQKGQLTGLANMGPWGWFFACLLIWIVAFPFYLAKRSAYLRINGKDLAASAVVVPAGFAVFAVELGLIGLLVFGHPKVGIQNLQSQVQTSIVSTFAKNPQLAALHVGALRLVHEGGNQYQGLLRVSQSGRTQTLTVAVTYDGRRFMWRILH